MPEESQRRTGFISTSAWLVKVRGTASRERLIRAKVPELVARGTTAVREDYDKGVLDHVVMLDPEGNEFLRGMNVGAHLN